MNPKSWNVPTIKKTVRYKKKIKVKTEKPSPLPSSDVAVMRFDKMTGELKEFVDLTDK